MVTLAARKAGDMFVLITDRSDLVPAMDMVRQEGVQICLDNMLAPVSSELSEQADFINTNLNNEES